MKRSKSSFEWIEGHRNDEFVLRAKREGYRSRASFKLLEIDYKYRLLKPGMVVVDLGAAPGGWTQVVLQKVGRRGRVIGIDTLDIESLPGAEFIKGDFATDQALAELLSCLNGSMVDLVISDMTPNLSGMKDIDQPRVLYLVDLVVEFSKKTLKPGGDVLVKCFEGEGIDQVRKEFANNFKRLNNVKPKASRKKSREIYIVGRGFLS